MRVCTAQSRQAARRARCTAAPGGLGVPGVPSPRRALAWARPAATRPPPRRRCAPARQCPAPAAATRTRPTGCSQTCLGSTPPEVSARISHFPRGRSNHYAAKQHCCCLGSAHSRHGPAGKQSLCNISLVAGTQAQGARPLQGRCGFCQLQVPYVRPHAGCGKSGHDVSQSANRIMNKRNHAKLLEPARFIPSYSPAWLSIVRSVRQNPFSHICVLIVDPPCQRAAPDKGFRVRSPTVAGHRAFQRSNTSPSAEQFHNTLQSPAGQIKSEAMCCKRVQLGAKLPPLQSLDDTAEVVYDTAAVQGTSLCQLQALVSGQAQPAGQKHKPVYDVPCAFLLQLTH